MTPPPDQPSHSRALQVGYENRSALASLPLFSGAKLAGANTEAWLERVR